MFNTTIGTLRCIGVIEGISLLVLLFIAMPLKYFTGQPPSRKVYWLGSWNSFHIIYDCSITGLHKVYMEV